MQSKAVGMVWTHAYFSCFLTRSSLKTTTTSPWTLKTSACLRPCPPVTVCWLLWRPSTAPPPTTGPGTGNTPPPSPPCTHGTRNIPHCCCCLLISSFHFFLCLISVDAAHPSIFYCVCQRCYYIFVFSPSEGWEQNGLYEFFRAKMRARRKKGQEKRNR